MEHAAAGGGAAAAETERAGRPQPRPGAIAERRASWEKVFCESDANAIMPYSNSIYGVLLSSSLRFAYKRFNINTITRDCDINLQSSSDIQSPTRHRSVWLDISTLVAR